MNKLNRKNAVFYIAIAWIIITSVLVYLNYPLLKSQFDYYFGKKQTSEPQPKPQEIKPEIPKVHVENQIIIEKIGVNAPLLESPSVKEADILKILESGIAHYPNTSLPGETGNIFVTGHSSNYRWAKGSYNYIFANLNKLSNDDLIVVYWSDVKYIYKVFEVIVVPPSDVSVMNQTNDSIISLMTCDPPGTTLKRRVVKAVQIEPDPKTNRPWEERFNK